MRSTKLVPVLLATLLLLTSCVPPAKVAPYGCHPETGDPLTSDGRIDTQMTRIMQTCRERAHCDGSGEFASMIDFVVVDGKLETVLLSPEEARQRLESQRQQ
ncbi:MAG: hypothetical protein P8Q36_14385 [Alphaproteobacteria bacterium]|nr:hypothetical protein [Alphaproteobacteria bacterium]